MLAAFRENGAPNSSSSTSGNSSAAFSVVNVTSTYTSTSTGCHSSSIAGSVTVQSFLSTYSSVGVPGVPRASQPAVPASSAASLFDSSLVPSTSSPTLAPSVWKAFVVAPGYAPIPGKLVAKITSGALVEFADLLAANIRAQEAEPHCQKNSGRDHRHYHMDSGLNHVPVDLLQYLPFSLAGYYAV